MFCTLPESQRVREVSVSAGAVSGVLHALLIAFLVTATAGAGERLRRAAASERATFAPLPFVPVRRASSADTDPRPERKRSAQRTPARASARLPAFVQIDVMLPDIPSVIPDIDLSEQMPTPEDFRAATAAGGLLGATHGSSDDHSGPYEPDQVTRMVSAVPGNPDPRYPDARDR